MFNDANLHNLRNFEKLGWPMHQQAWLLHLPTICAYHKASLTPVKAGMVRFADATVMTAVSTDCEGTGFVIAVLANDRAMEQCSCSIIHFYQITSSYINRAIQLQ